VTPLRPEDSIAVPPTNIEAEQALLGAILVNPVAYVRVAAFLAPEHFATTVHGRIYAAIAKLIERGQPADPVMLKNVFDKDGALAEIGGAQYLVRLAESAVTIINAEWYGRRIVDLAQRRRLIEVGKDLVARAYSCDLGAPASTLIVAAADQLLEAERIGAGSTALSLTVAASLASRPRPDRPWLVRDWIPRRQVTLLSGDGGVGKSLLGMQLQLATAIAGQWLGLDTLACPSYGLYAEDDDDELHRRLLNIADVMGADVARLDNMAWHSAAADAAAELVELDDRGAIRLTSYYRQIERQIIGIGARLVVLDAVTNLFGGDEIKRRQVNGFIGVLRRLAMKIDGAVVLVAHPSAQGISTGTGLSGSTHWNNAVRSRLYFELTKGNEADPDERTLSRLKSNYASAGQVIRLRWVDGGFRALGSPGSIDRAAMGMRAERVFLTLLTSTYAEGIWTSPNPVARNYAPRIFASDPDSGLLGKAAFVEAMRRLIKTGQIKTEAYGRPSEPRMRLALA